MGVANRIQLTVLTVPAGKSAPAHVVLSVSQSISGSSRSWRVLPGAIEAIGSLSGWITYTSGAVIDILEAQLSMLEKAIEANKGTASAGRFGTDCLALTREILAGAHIAVPTGALVLVGQAKPLYVAPGLPREAISLGSSSPPVNTKSGAGGA
jgi:hypothetical protein